MPRTEVRISLCEVPLVDPPCAYVEKIRNSRCGKVRVETDEALSGYEISPCCKPSLGRTNGIVEGNGDAPRPSGPDEPRSRKVRDCRTGLREVG